MAPVERLAFEAVARPRVPPELRRSPKRAAPCVRPRPHRRRSRSSSPPAPARRPSAPPSGPRPGAAARPGPSAIPRCCGAAWSAAVVTLGALTRRRWPRPEARSADRVLPSSDARVPRRPGLVALGCALAAPRVARRGGRDPPDPALGQGLPDRADDRRTRTAPWASCSGPRSPPTARCCSCSRTSDFHGIWMKNCQFPIDIVWLDEARKVVHVAPKVPPCRAEPCPVYVPDAQGRLRGGDERGGGGAREDRRSAPRWTSRSLADRVRLAPRPAEQPRHPDPQQVEPEHRARRASSATSTSGVGVITAERTKATRTAYLKWRIRKPGVTRPMRASTKIDHRELEHERPGRAGTRNRTSSTRPPWAGTACPRRRTGSGSGRWWGRARSGRRRRRPRKKSVPITMNGTA